MSGEKRSKLLMIIASILGAAIVWGISFVMFVLVGNFVAVWIENPGPVSVYCGGVITVITLMRYWFNAWERGEL